MCTQDTNISEEGKEDNSELEEAFSNSAIRYHLEEEGVRPIDWFNSKTGYFDMKGIKQKIEEAAKAS